MTLEETANEAIQRLYDSIVDSVDDNVDVETSEKVVDAIRLVAKLLLIKEYSRGDRRVLWEAIANRVYGAAMRKAPEGYGKIVSYVLERIGEASDPTIVKDSRQRITLRPPNYSHTRELGGLRKAVQTLIPHKRIVGGKKR